MANWVISGGPNPHPTKNDYKGRFTTEDKKTEFINVGTTVGDKQFQDEYYLLGISLPNVTDIGISSFNNSYVRDVILPQVKHIGANAFHGTDIIELNLPNLESVDHAAFNYTRALSKVNLPKLAIVGSQGFNGARITELHLPSATTIKSGAFASSPLTKITLEKLNTIEDQVFHSAVNLPSTVVTIPHKFLTDQEKDKVFTSGWDQITFIDTSSSIILRDKIITKQFPYKGKKVVSLTMNGKILTLKP